MWSETRKRERGAIVECHVLCLHETWFPWLGLTRVLQDSSRVRWSLKHCEGGKRRHWEEAFQVQHSKKNGNIAGSSKEVSFSYVTYALVHYPVSCVTLYSFLSTKTVLAVVSLLFLIPWRLCTCCFLTRISYYVVIDWDDNLAVLWTHNWGTIVVLY